MPKISTKQNLAEKIVKDGIELDYRNRLTIEYVKVDDIYPNDYNPNQHTADSFDLLVKSLLYFGFTMPIVVNRRDMKIVDGENRYGPPVSSAMMRFLYASWTSMTRN